MPIDHRVAQLQEERLTLKNELNILRSREHALLSPHQLKEWAGEGFRNPTAAAVIFAPPSGGTVAALGQH